MVRATRIIEASASNVQRKKNKIKSRRRISGRIKKKERKKEIYCSSREENKKQFLAEFESRRWLVPFEF